MTPDYVAYHGNAQAAKNYAEPIIQQTLNDMTVLFSYFQLEFHLIFFPITSQAPPRGLGETNQNWINSINAAFRSQYPCIKQDCIIVPTTDLSGGHGFNKVALVWAGIPKFVVAHEIGHILGLQHPTAPPQPGQPSNCPHDCTTMPTFMCETTGPITFNNCDYKHLNSPTGVFTQVACSGPCRCDLWADFANGAPEDFVCQPEPSVSIGTNQPYLTTGCGKNTSFYTITINGGSTGVQDAALALRFQDQIYDWDPNAPGQDFNSMVVVDQDFSELQIMDPATQPPQQKLFTVPANEVLTFNAALLFNPQAPLVPPPGNNLKLQVTARLAYQIGNTNHLKTGVAKPKEFIPVNGVIHSFPSGTDQPYIATGGLGLASSVNNSEISLPIHLIVGSGQGIGIQYGSGPTIVKTVHPVTTIEGCTTMWEGIDIDATGNQLVLNKAIVKDAQNAVTVNPGTKLIATECSFLNNNIGVRTTFDIGVKDELTLLGNRFETTVSGMKPPYAGQYPPPKSHGYAGILLVDNSTMALQKGPNGLPNVFENLLNGIVAFNSAFTVKDALFHNLVSLAQPLDNPPMPPTNPLTGYPTVWTGVGVFASNSFVSVEGMGAGPGATPSFENCPVGIETVFSSLTAINNRMVGMGEGIRYRLGTSNQLGIAGNRINASVSGISAFQPGVSPSATTITNNFITMDGDELGIGIQVALADGPKLSKEKALVRHNTITMTEGIAGMYVSTARGVDLFGNVVEVENPDTRSGINTLGSHNLLVHCNAVYGDDASVNLRADGTWLSTWACNGSNDGAVGLNFSGECSGSDVRGNYLGDIDEGMYYGMPGTGIGTVLVGTQEHRGNIFDNSGAVYAGEDDDVIQNRHIVDPNQNAQYYPANISGPPLWFVPENNAASTFTCTFVDCPPQSLPFPREDDDIRIAGDSIFADHFADALLSQAKKHLFTRLSEDGLPGGSAQVLHDFMSPSSLTAYQQFGEVDLAFRNAFAVSGTADTLLRTYELALGSGLTSLRGLDSLLLSGELSPQDSSAASGQRDTLLTGIADTFDLWTALRASLTDARRVLLDSVAAQNNSLSPSLLWETNEKTVRGIYLATIGTDTVLTLNGAQTSQLEAIAEQCPLEGGTAVYWARMLLELLTGARVVYNDADSCEATSERFREMERLVGPSSVRIYPNPTNGVFRVEYDLGDEPGAVFLLHNSLGQQVLQHRLPDVYGTVLLNMAHLPTGTYFYMIPGLGGEGSSGKILISKH